MDPAPESCGKLALDDGGVCAGLRTRTPEPWLRTWPDGARTLRTPLPEHRSIPRTDLSPAVDGSRRERPPICWEAPVQCAETTRRRTRAPTIQPPTVG